VPRTVCSRHPQHFADLACFWWFVISKLGLPMRAALPASLLPFPFLLPRIATYPSSAPLNARSPPRKFFTPSFNYFFLKAFFHVSFHPFTLVWPIDFSPTACHLPFEIENPTQIRLFPPLVFPPILITLPPREPSPQRMAKTASHMLREHLFLLKKVLAQIFFP